MPRTANKTISGNTTMNGLNTSVVPAVKTSRSGRIIIPRLKTWTGERVITKPNGTLQYVEGGLDLTETFYSERSFCHRADKTSGNMTSMMFGTSICSVSRVEMPPPSKVSRRNTKKQATASADVSKVVPAFSRRTSTRTIVEESEMLLKETTESVNERDTKPKKRKRRRVRLTMPTSKSKSKNKTMTSVVRANDSTAIDSITLAIESVIEKACSSNSPPPVDNVTLAIESVIEKACLGNSPAPVDNVTFAIECVVQQALEGTLVQSSGSTKRRRLNAVKDVDTIDIEAGSVKRRRTTLIAAQQSRLVLSSNDSLGISTAHDSAYVSFESPAVITAKKKIAGKVSPAMSDIPEEATPASSRHLGGRKTSESFATPRGTKTFARKVSQGPEESLGSLPSSPVIGRKVRKPRHSLLAPLSLNKSGKTAKQATPAKESSKKAKNTPQQNNSPILTQNKKRGRKPPNADRQQLTHAVVATPNRKKRSAAQKTPDQKATQKYSRTTAEKEVNTGKRGKTSAKPATKNTSPVSKSAIAEEVSKKGNSAPVKSVESVDKVSKKATKGTAVNTSPKKLNVRQERTSPKKVLPGPISMFREPSAAPQKEAKRSIFKAPIISAVPKKPEKKKVPNEKAPFFLPVIKSLQRSENAPKAARKDASATENFLLDLPGPSFQKPRTIKERHLQMRNLQCPLNGDSSDSDDDFAGSLFSSRLGERNEPQTNARKKITSILDNSSSDSEEDNLSIRTSTSPYSSRSNVSVASVFSLNEGASGESEQNSPNQSRSLAEKLVSYGHAKTLHRQLKESFAIPHLPSRKLDTNRNENIKGKSIADKKKPLEYETMYNGFKMQVQCFLPSADLTEEECEQSFSEWTDRMEKTRFQGK